MLIDVGLALAAAIVAIIGTVTNPGAQLKRLLVVMAVMIFGLAIWKAVRDEHEENFIRSAVIQSLSPGPEAMGHILDKLHDVSKEKGYTGKNMFTALNGGVVLYLMPNDFNNDNGSSADKANNVGIIVLDQLDLANAYAEYLSNDGKYNSIRNAMAQSYDFSSRDQELYSRICVLLSASARNILFKPPIACDNDSNAGITVTANVNGIEQQLILPPDKIATYGNKDAKIAFRQIDAEFRKIIEAAQMATKPQR